MESIGDYRISKVIGEGFSSNVYLATHAPSGQRVALKLPATEKLLLIPQI